MNKKSLTKLSETLKSELLAQFPEWQKYVEIFESHFNSGKFSSLYVEIPSPIDENCFLSISDRDYCVEIGFYDGNPPGPAERQIGCSEGFEDEDVAEVIEFIKEIIDEKIVAGRERMFWLFGNKAAPPQFIETIGLDKKRKKLVSICSWKGKFNRKIEKIKF